MYFYEKDRNIGLQYGKNLFSKIVRKDNYKIRSIYGFGTGFKFGNMWKDKMMTQDAAYILPRKRTRFRGTVGSILHHKNPEQSRILLQDICLLISGKSVIQSQLFYLSRKFQSMDLNVGDEVEFDARIKPDRKGVSSHSIRLNYPTKIFRYNPGIERLLF